MTMIEKVARAIAVKYAHYFGADDLVSPCIPYAASSLSLMARGLHKRLGDNAYMPFWEIFVPEARAAIEAMREPTKEMIAIGNQYVEWASGADDAWDAMIDKALSE